MARFRWVNNTPSDFVVVAKADTDKRIKETSINLYNHIIALSPVDTGRFRANNLISFDKPVYTATDDTDYAKKQGEVQMTILGMPKGTKKVYIQNNLPYAERLENGHSKQAATGIYRVAFTAIVGK